jgi:predicted NUDIX family phosphoesterase
MGKLVISVPKHLAGNLGVQGFARRGFLNLATLICDHHVIEDRDVCDSVGTPPRSPHQQLVVYGLVVVGDQFVLTYRRRGDHDRADLRGVRSLGIGGHVEPCDFPPLGPWNEDSILMSLERAFLREVEEEVGATPFRVLPFGLINDPVGAGLDHLGVVYLAHFPRFDKMTFSPEILQPAFFDRKKVRELPLEPWSRLVAEAL